MVSWQGKSALVTGAGTGIGKEVSKELARRGAIVYVSALTHAEAQSVVADIETLGGRAHAVVLDVTDHTRLREVMELVVAEQGQLDLVINNAGIIFVGEYFDMDDAYLEQLVDVNITAVMKGTLYAYRIMKSQGHGLIANVASQGGLMAVGSMAAYSASKHAVVGLTESVAGEAREFGVQLQAICPGNVASEMLTKAKTRGTSAQGVLDSLPKVMPTDAAAHYIVDNLGNGKHKIVVTALAKLLYLLVRIWPGFGRFGAHNSMLQFRQRRDDSLNQH